MPDYRDVAPVSWALPPGSGLCLRPGDRPQPEVGAGPRGAKNHAIVLPDADSAEALPPA